MDLLSVTASIVGLISAAVKISRSLQSLTLRHDDEIGYIERELSLSIDKFTVWQENWTGQVHGASIPAKLLWGPQGWAKIQILLENIANTSGDIKRLLRDVQENQESQPRLRWRRAVELISKKPRAVRHQKLQDLARSLNSGVDALWIYSETAFDSLHGLLAFEPKPTGRDTLLRSALRSRDGSLKLYSLCLAQTEDCNLEMDLLDGGLAWKELSYRGRDTLSLCYRLVTEPREKELQKLLVRDVEEFEMSPDELNNITEPSGLELQIFKPHPGSKIVKVPQLGLGSPHCLRIPQDRSETVRLDSEPESLAKILEDMEVTSYLSTKEGFDTEAKVDLAFQVIECGFFLLGTPWFSSLSSRNLRRLKSMQRRPQNFMLRTQALNLKDLVSDDPGALAETSQLFRLGVLLTEIALETPDVQSQSGSWEHDPSRLNRLPLVEKAMGAQYCKATAFCLQYREDRFLGPEKYDGKLYAEWATYLAQLLEDYHSQVFLRQVLGRIDMHHSRVTADSDTGCKISEI